MLSAYCFLGSKADVDCAQTAGDTIKDCDVDSGVGAASAHKAPELVAKRIDRTHARTVPAAVITCVGMSNGMVGSEPKIRARIAKVTSEY